MSRFIIVAGMPGAGKTTYLEKFATENPEWYVADDFFQGATSANRGLKSSPLHAALIDHLRAGDTCVISDIEFCKERSRLLVPQQLQTELAEIFSHVAIEWHYFENDFEACVANVLRQSIGTNEKKEAIKALLELSAKYSIAPGHKTIRVWRPASGL